MTPKDIIQKAPGLTSAVNTYLLAKVYADGERAIIDKMKRDILNGSVFTVRPEFTRQTEPNRITEPSRDYLMSDEQFETYHAECQRRIVAMGYDVPEGHCPALIAERILTEAEHLVIDESSALTGLKDGVHSLLCKGMDIYHKYIDLCVKMIVNMPGYVAPKLQNA